MALGQFHVNENNDVKPCKARVKPCKFSNSDFDTVEEAQKEAEKRVEKEFKATYGSFATKTKGDEFVIEEETPIEYVNLKTPQGNILKFDKSKNRNPLKKSEYIRGFKRHMNDLDNFGGIRIYAYTEERNGVSIDPGEMEPDPDDSYYDTGIYNKYPSIKTFFDKGEYVKNSFLDDYKKNEKVDEGLIDSLDKVGCFEPHNYDFDRKSYIGDRFVMNEETKSKIADILTVYKILNK